MKYYTKAKHKECIVEMRDKYGEYAVYCFCKCNAYKYLYRAGLKENNPALQDWEKAKWYIDYANSIVSKHPFNPKYKRVNIDYYKEVIT